MIDYKNAAGGDSILERAPSAAIEGPVSLTWLWEVIVRTKRLPDDLDPKVLFVVLRDRLRNPEREVRQHALRVLADLIPVVEQHVLDKHMELLLADLIVNLSYVAPAVRKGTVDVVRIHIKHSPHPNEVLRKLLTAIPQDSHLMLGLMMAAPYFAGIPQISEDTLAFLMGQLMEGTNQEFLREASLYSLVKIRTKLGADKFNELIGAETVRDFEEICKGQNLLLDLPKPMIVDDNVILETEITLETGPAITMKIHEETSKPLPGDFSGEDGFRLKRQLVRVITEESDAEMATRSPRKVRFGGEVVKMRTPESDSNHTSDESDVQTSVVIDRPTSIKITVSESVAAIKTRHRSMIPVRVTTGGSNPSTPRKKLQPKKRLHKSAPELRRQHASKIPLRHDGKVAKGSPQRGDQAISSGLGSGEISEPAQLGTRRNSPVPVHHEIELFHNLTRSPVPPKKQEQAAEEPRTEAEESYSSFQVCKDEPKSPNLLDGVVQNLAHKDDVWNKARNLDDLVAVLRQEPSSLATSKIRPLLQALFACEQNHRLQSRAQEALQMVIATMDPQTLRDSLDLIGRGSVRIGPPNGVRLALLAMQKSSPREFFQSLEGAPPTEGVLQALIAAARTFPSSEIDVVKGVQLAFNAMKDPKRAVKQAALEVLASLAQVAGNTAILETITDAAKNQDNYEHLLRVVRTRLSRKQLPTVDLNGNVRYSSPREQEEFDWLCGGSISIRKTMSLSSIRVTNNYWKHNSRHDLDITLSSLEISETSNDDSSTKDQIWAIDPSSFPKLDNVTIEKATLCPVYVLRRDSPQINGKSYRNFDRGRSNSPPPTRRVDLEDREDGAGNRARRFFRQNEQFRKSFSSEHIYGGNAKPQEHNSLSSRSSTTSTGSSNRSGIWLKDFRSGIPVPIASSDSKLKLRYARHPSESFTGPLVAQESLNRTKIDSPQTTPVLLRASPQQVPAQQPPPPSSGSESSGYFTPPPEHHLKDQVLERFASEETFEENNNLSPEPEPNFQVVDSEASESHEVAFLRQSSVSSAEGAEEPADPQIAEEQDDRLEQTSPLTGFDFDENPRVFADPRSKSKSEANLKSSLPEIERKNVNSAPPLNDLVDAVPYRFTETPQVSLPGSVASTEHTPSKKQVRNPSSTSIEQAETPRRLTRRTISSRGSSLRRDCKSSKNFDVRPFSRPKEALHQGLAQMDSTEWETTIQGLNCLTRLARNHPEILELQMHSICMALAKNIKNLRSQVARKACQAASEIFATSRRGLDMELEELAGPLLQRTADTNKFLRSDANAALDVMTLNLSIPRVVAVVASKGSTHQNCVVRAAATRLLSDIATRIGHEKVFQLPKETRDKFLAVGANGLTEGSLETRKHAKALMGMLAKNHSFHRALLEAVPQHTIRHIAKAISSLK